MYCGIQRKHQPKVLSKHFFAILFWFLSIDVLSQCANTSSLGGGSFVNDNTISGTPFDSPSNVSDEDGSVASAAILISLFGNTKTNYLKTTNFGFNIPTSATVCGVSVWIKKRATSTVSLAYSVADEQVRLVVAGSVTGSNKANSDLWSGAATFSQYGDETDTWGVTLTPAQVNSSNFGVAIAANVSGALSAIPIAEIDYVMMQVSYMNATVPLILGDYTTNISGNCVLNTWTMLEEEDNAKISLQRSDDGKNWKTIDIVIPTYNIGKHRYEFMDWLPNSGAYFYRLELIHASGRVTYSKVNTITCRDDLKRTVYPNPATNFVRITNVHMNDAARVFSINGEQVAPPLVYNSGVLQVNISTLTQGMYFVILGDKKLSFMKQ